MYTQEIACPRCGRLTAVNFLDKRGSTTTPCLHCATKISVSTNDYGEVVDIKGLGDCYIVTACLASRGLTSDCDELAAIREFRDTYVSMRADGDDILSDYYRRAPDIVAAIESSPNSREIYDAIYIQFIERALVCIRESRPSEAVDLYRQLGKWLADRTRNQSEPWPG